MTEFRNVTGGLGGHPYLSFLFFFFNDTATTEIYTLSLHDALPISIDEREPVEVDAEYQNEQEPREERRQGEPDERERRRQDRKSTRLNSSHLVISYAVFCLKKKKRCRGRRARCSTSTA